MSQKLTLIFILIVSGTLLFNNIGGLSIYALDEAKNAEAAREMMVRGDLIVPTFNYNLRTDKPPLHYYFMMAAYKAFGVNEFSARFFSALAGLLTILIVYLFALRYANLRVAFYSALTLMASLHYMLQFQMAVPDPYLIFFMTAAMMCFYIYYTEPDKKKYLYFFYISLALGVLSKGPVALALPGLATLLFLLLQRSFSWKRIRSFKPFAGALLVLVIAAPWYIAVGMKTGGEWTSEFFLKHNFGRYADEMEGHGGVFLVTFAYVLAGLLPFSMLIVQTFAHAIRRRFDPLIMFCLLYAGVIVLFFAFSGTKLPNYTVPAYPFIAILTGLFIDSLSAERIRKYKIKWSFFVYLIIALAFPAGVYFGLSQEDYLRHLRGLAFYFLLLPAGAGLGIYFLYRKKIALALYSVAASFILMSFLFFGFIFPRVDRENPVTTLLPAIDRSKPVVAYRIFNPAFIFYLQKQAPAFDNPEELENFLKNQHEEVFVITRTRYQEQLEAVERLNLEATRKDLFETTTTAIWKYEPD